MELKECTLAGKYKITGSQKCEYDKSNAEAGEIKEAHSLICKPSGSSLELSGSAVEYEGSDSRTVEVENEESKTTEKPSYLVEE